MSRLRNRVFQRANRTRGSIIPRYAATNDVAESMNSFIPQQTSMLQFPTQQCKCNITCALYHSYLLRKITTCYVTVSWWFEFASHRNPIRCKISRFLSHRCIARVLIPRELQVYQVVSMLSVKMSVFLGNSTSLPVVQLTRKRRE